MFKYQNGALSYYKCTDLPTFTSDTNLNKGSKCFVDTLEIYTVGFLEVYFYYSINQKILSTAIKSLVCNKRMFYKCGCE